MKIKDRLKPKLPPVEPGVYIGVCVGVVDLGEQYNERFHKYANDLRIIWELAGETVAVDGEDKPRQLSKDFAISDSKKSKLRQFLSSWNGRQYSDEEFRELDVFDQLGKACQLQVALSETGEYANIENVMGLPKGVPAPAPLSPFLQWDMDHWDDQKFLELPNWMQEKIQKSTQYQKLHTPTDPLDFGIPAPGDPSPAEEACPI